MPHDSSADKECVLFNEMPKTTGVEVDEAFTARWDRIHQLRDDVKKALELARKNKVIGASLDAKVQLVLRQASCMTLSNRSRTSWPMCLSSLRSRYRTGGKGEFAGEEVPELSVTVSHAEGEKCARCWSFSDTVGSDPAHPDVCKHCAEALS